jgi:hypothetical protein
MVSVGIEVVPNIRSVCYILEEDQRDVVAVVKAEQFRSFMHTLVPPCRADKVAYPNSYLVSYFISLRTKRMLS